MQVIVRDRRQGKTTLLIEWMLRGHIQQGYPQWSRVIVVPNHREVIHTWRMIRSYIAERPMEFGNYWLCQHSHPHMDCQGPKEQAHKHTLAQIQKAVWNLRELSFNSQGAHEFEYALDNADELFTRMDSIYMIKRPAIITLTGELYDENVRN